MACYSSAAIWIGKKWGVPAASCFSIKETTLLKTLAVYIPFNTNGYILLHLPWKVAAPFQDERRWPIKKFKGVNCPIAPSKCNTVSGSWTKTYTSRVIRLQFSVWNTSSIKKWFGLLLEQSENNVQEFVLKRSREATKWQNPPCCKIRKLILQNYLCWRNFKFWNFQVQNFNLSH